MPHKDPARAKEWQKAYDARRIKQQSLKGQLWQKQHREETREGVYRRREENGREARFMVIDSFKPLEIQCDDPVCIASDWHLPFHDYEFITKMLDDCHARDIRTLIVPGDFWDCDHFMKFTKMGWSETFKEEIKNVADWLELLKTHFDNIYFTRGNHEKRWIDANRGLVGMEELFALTKVNDGYTVTLDDHLYLEHQGQKWLCCHPGNFRVTNLSVVKDLAAKYQCNIFGGHGHQWAQGYDRSGNFKVVDGGGMFDPLAIEYLRNTTAYPTPKGGYYTLIDGQLTGTHNLRR